MLTLYVSPLGNDRSNGRARVPGASDGPLATLERARDEIRRIKKERGGLPDGGVTVEPQRLASNVVERIFEHLMMFWTGIRRDAATVLAEQQRNRNH